MTITASPTVSVGERRRLLHAAFDGDVPMPHRNHDVTPDGRAFVMIAAAEANATETVVVLGWLAELRARLAAVR